MKTLETELQRAMESTPAFTKQRNKALAGVKWRLRCGLLCAGLSRDGRCILTSDDSREAITFNGLDNEARKLAYYEAATGYKFTVELCAP